MTHIPSLCPVARSRNERIKPNTAPHRTRSPPRHVETVGSSTGVTTIVGGWIMIEEAAGSACGNRFWVELCGGMGSDDTLM